MPVTVPTKTDGSLGREKQEQPLNALIPVNLDFHETAEESERLKDKVIELCGAVNDLEAGAGAGSVLLLDMPVATAAVAATETWGRGPLNGPAAPAGTASVSLVDDPALPGRNCLRVGATGSAEGLWLNAIQNVTLPAAGYVLEVDVADLPDVTLPVASGIIGIAYSEHALGGARSTPRGIFLQLYRGAANNELLQWRLESGNYTRMQTLASLETAGVLRDDAAVQAHGIKVRIEVRKVDASTPLRYAVAVDVRDAGGRAYGGRSSIATPLNADLDAKTFNKLGLGGFTDSGGGPAGASWISVRQLRVWSL